MLDMLMTRPQPRSAIASMKCLVTRKTLVRSVVMTSSQASLVIFLKVESRLMAGVVDQDINGAEIARNLVAHGLDFRLWATLWA